MRLGSNDDDTNADDDNANNDAMSQYDHISLVGHLAKSAKNEV